MVAINNIRLPFTNFDTLKDEITKSVTAGTKSLGAFADFARGATAQFIYLIVGVVVALGLFINPALEMDRPARGHQNNLYTACCREINERFSNFYGSFEMIMKAQVIISAIDVKIPHR